MYMKKICPIYNLSNRFIYLKSVFLLIFLSVAIYNYAQSNKISFPQVIPSSPTVAALEKYGNYPINYNTGTVSISVPLYSFALGKGMNLDIGLNYHPSGIRVEDVSGRVGTGWSLIAGGCLSREVRGIKDEESNGFYNFIKTHKGYTFPPILDEITHAKTLDSLNKEILDPAPDIFSLNVPGLSCKFFIANDGQFHTIPYSNIKISRHPLSNTSGEGEWEIINESGIRYIFYEMERVTTHDGMKEYVSTWWLHSILSAEGTTLATFEYSRIEPVYHQIMRSTKTFEGSSTPGFPEDMKSSYFQQKTVEAQSGRYQAYDLRKVTVPGKGYISIESKTDRPGQVWKLINKVQCYSNKNILENEYNLSYSYSSDRPFLSQITRSGGGKTQLYRSFTYYPGLPRYDSKSQDLWGYYNGATNSSLFPFQSGLGYYVAADRYPTEKAIAGSLKETVYPTGGKTLFEYENNKVYSPENVYKIEKQTYSHRQENYGETTGNFTTVAQRVDVDIEMSIHPAGIYSIDIRLIRVKDNRVMLSFTESNATDREFTFMGTNSDGTRRYTRSIKSLELEAGTYKWVTKIIDKEYMGIKPSPIVVRNTYYKEVVSGTTYEKLVGGLRIARISNYDSDGKLSGKISYSYLNKEGRCSGIAGPTPVFTRSYVITEILSMGSGSASFHLALNEIGDVNLVNYSGSAVQYTHVTEEKQGTGTEKLRTDYEYYYRDFVRYVLPPGYPHATYSLNDYKEGLLTRKTDYQFKNNAFTPLRIENNTYQVVEYPVPSFKALDFSKIYLSPQYAPRAEHKYRLGFYDLKAAKVYLSSKKIEEITDNGTITTINDHFYENPTYQQVSRSKQTNSNGLVYETNYKYCFDENTTVTTHMKTRNILAPPLHTIQKVNSKQILQQDVLYDLFPGNIIEPRTIREQSGASTPYSELNYHNYDCYGNPVYISMNGTNHSFYLWSYNGQFPIAEIKSASYTYAEIEAVVKSVFSVTNIDALSKLAEPNEAKLKDGSLQRALPNALVTTYTYKPLTGILTATDPRSVITYYEYDSFGRLTNTKDNNGKLLQHYDYHYRNQ